MELNRLYSYEVDGEQRMGMLEAIVPKNMIKYAVLDNGDSIALDRFQLIAQVIQENTGGNENEHVGNDLLNVNIKTDKNGLPVLPTEDGKGGKTPMHQVKKNHVVHEEGLNDVIAPEQYMQSNPIIILLQKAKLGEEVINIPVPVKLIDKNLYATIVNSFEDSEAAIFDFLAEKIDLDTLRGLVAEELKKRYK